MNYRFFCTKIFLSGLLALLPLVPFPTALADEVKIGLRAHRGAVKALKKWQATADLLTREIDEHRFILIPFEFNSELNQAVSRSEFDFILTNPAAHVEQKIRYGVSVIATLINKRKGKGYTRFGSVIFSRADRTDINSLEDLRGKTFMAVDELGFGGWRVAWRRLLAAKIDPYRDFTQLSFGGGVQQNVVFSVQDGLSDAGSVRTDLLERMAARQEIDFDDFKVIGERKTEGFGFVHSTRLYPEWPFAKAKHTPDKLSRRVASVLYNIPADSMAAKNGKYAGWTVPLDYRPVDELLRELKAGPYTTAGSTLRENNPETMWNRYTVLIFVLVALVISSYTVIRLSQKLKQAENQLRKLQSEQHDKISK